MSTGVVSQSVERARLSGKQVEEMFGLFANYYDNANRRIFTKDLEDKNWVVLIEDSKTRGIVGFSTLAFYRSAIRDEQVGVVYSGDTIIDKAYWDTTELPRIWIQTVKQVGASYPQPLYWLLISSGYKTYRYLSVFYKEFYPHCDCPTPAYVQDLMEHLATERFGEEYIPELGVVRFTEGATPLKAGVADVVDGRLKNPHVKFFVEKNPGYIDGDELVCITKIHPDNFTPAGKRLAKWG
jgi:hypothetical protein